MSKIREFLKGKKTYLTGVAGILSSLVAWSQGEINDVTLIGAIFIALQTMFVRAGVAKNG